MNTDQDLEEWIAFRVQHFIEDALHYMIVKRGGSPKVVSEMLVKAFYDALFRVIVKAEAYAGRMPLDASAKSARAAELVHEKVVHKILQLAVSEIQAGSRFVWTAWISKRQKPL